MTQFGDFLGHFVGGQLAAFARFRTLGHLDLKNPGVGKVLDRHAEAALATCLIPQFIESPLGIGWKRSGSSPPSPVFELAPSRFMAMASVSWASLLIEPCDMAPGAEPLNDRRGRLDFLDRDRLARHEREQPAQRQQIAALIVNQLGIFGIFLRIVVKDGLLQFDDRVGIPLMLFAVVPELILAAEIEFQRIRLGRIETRAMPRERLAGDHFEVAAADSRGRAGEISLDYVGIQADGLELLGGMIAAESGNAHL